MSFGRSRIAKALLLLATAAVLVAPLALTSVAWAAGEEAAPSVANPDALKWAVMAAAISVGAGCIGAAVAVAYVGAAAVAAVAEKPQLAGRTLIFVGLAEGIAIYGLIIAIMILGKV